MRRLVEAAQQGSVRAASRLMSLLEDNPSLLPELFAGMSHWPQPRLIIGLTGAPGVGKSTLVDGLLASWRKRLPATKLGVVAVDPSSPFTGGAVLGDRIRMMDHATDEKIFIRSLASRGHLGGLTLGTQGVVRVMGLVGCEVVLIETVGVGQSEVEVAGVADMTLIALAPGQGDGVQLLKAGLMEAGDIFVVNKADRPGSDKLTAELTATLSLTGALLGKAAVGTASERMHHGQDAGEVPAVPVVRQQAEVFKVSALERNGIDDLVAGIEARAERTKGQIAARRAASVQEEVRSAILEAARRKIDAALGANGAAGAKIAGVLQGRSTVKALAEELMRSALEREA